MSEIKFNKVFLRELIKIKNGKDHQDLKSGMYPVYGSGGVIRHVDKFIYDKESILLPRKGSLNNIQFASKPFWTVDTCYYTEVNAEKVVPYFLFKILSQYDIEKLNTGSAVPSMTFEKYYSIEVKLPSLSYQNKIASILSAYDSLIENNQKQIKLLEEAAQRLYKEWFIDLRFPGHENLKIVDGVPDGWKKGTLGEIADHVGCNENKSSKNKYAYYLPIDCLPKKSLTYTDTNDIQLAESSLISFKCGDILFGAMRPYFHKVVIARDEGLTRSTCFVINSKEKHTWSFLTMLLFTSDTVNYATQISVGTTMPYVRWSDFVQMPILIPSNDICNEFGKLFVPIANKLSKLAKQNILLTEARDRLLPKLMSGEIEVMTN